MRSVDSGVGEIGRTVEKATPARLGADDLSDAFDGRVDGLDLLGMFKEIDPDMPVLVISGHGTIETAVAAIRKGAYDFVEKPFTADRLLVAVRRGSSVKMQN